MSVRPWNTILDKPARPTPWYVWPLAIVCAILGGMLLTSLKSAVLLFGGIAIVLALRAILAQPINGFLIALCIFPEYTVFRGFCELYEIPLPLSLIGMWPEVVLGLMLVSLVCMAIRGGPRLRLTWLDIPMVLIFASGVYGLTLSLLQRDAMASIYGFHGSLTPFCFYFLARWLHHRPEDLRRVLRFWLIGFALLAAVSIFDFIFRPEIFIKIAIQVREQFWGKFNPYQFFRWYPRMQSLIFAEQTWGTLCGFVGLYCMARLGSRVPMEGRRTRSLLWLVFGLALFGLIFSMSRGAHVCWVIACVVMFQFRGGHRRILVVGLVVGIVALAVAFLAFGSEERVNWLVTRTVALTDRKNDLAYERVNQWERALKAFPLFPAGRGLGKAAGYAMYHGTGDGFDFVADGGYFKILAEQGIPGVTLFVLGSLGLIGVLARVVRGTGGEDRALALTVLSLFCGLLVQNIGGNIFDSYYFPQVFWMLTGLVLGRYVSGVAAPAVLRSVPGWKELPAVSATGVEKASSIPGSAG